MATCRCSPNVDSIGSNKELLLRNSQTPADATNALRDLDVKDYFAVPCVTIPSLNRVTNAYHDVAPNVPEEEEIKEELDM